MVSNTGVIAACHGPDSDEYHRADGADDTIDQRMTPTQRLRGEMQAGRKHVTGLTDRARTVLDARNDPDAKPATRQLREMIQLRRSVTALSPREYHEYRLHDLSLWADVDITEVGGMRMWNWLHETLNNPNWDAVVSDKAIMAMVFRQAGIPHPDITALSTQYDRACGSIPVLRNRHELGAFMMGRMPCPAFIKPVVGGHGDSCHRIDAVDAATGTLTVDGDAEMSVDAFVDGLYDPTGWGFLFQKAVQPSPETIPVIGNGLSGLRMVVLLHDGGPVLFRSIWKLPAPGSVTDNYGQGNRGNGVAAVDVATGVVQATHWGRPPSQPMDSPHPVTGAPITGIRVPLWDDVVEVTLAAARVFPGFRFQHWDVGLTSDGPVVYELNNGGGLYDSDLPGTPGSYDDQLQRFVDEYGHAPQHARHRGMVAR